MTLEVGHIPVLAQEIVQLLAPQAGQVMLDCTLGRGGHAALLAPMLGPTGRYIGLDVDPVNLDFARARLQALRESHPSCARIDVMQANFTQARDVLAQLGVPRVDLLLADLGFASNQMDDPQRGFSFACDGPLDMRLDPTLQTTAADLVNRLPEQELANIIYRFGEERLSRKIARNIVALRRQSPIHTTAVLADAVRRAYGWRASGQRIDPATRTFMALRIAVNGELDALEHLLHDLPDLSTPSATAGIISFHSLEDRLVKHAFVKLVQDGRAERLTKKPVTATETEIAANPRSRSAKLRVIRMTPAGTLPPVR